MAKDTPNKPDDVKAPPAVEQPSSAAEPPTSEIPSAGEVVVSAEKINELAGEKRKAAKPVQASRAEVAKEPSTIEEKPKPPMKGKERPPKEGGTEKPEVAERPEPSTPAADPPVTEIPPDAAKSPKSPAKGKGRPPKEAEADKPKPESSTAKKPNKPADKVIPLHPSDPSLSRLKDFSPVKTKPSAPAKPQPAPDSPELAERKRKLEKELREKYGIPKTDALAEPWVAPEEEKVVRIPHEKLHAFKGHTFNVEKNAKFMAFVASIRAHGVTQPVIVRPDGDNYEIISGHRRDQGGIEAGIPYSPCIVRALNDEQAIQQMVEDNVNNRDISTMELARSLKVQLDSIKRQGAREALADKNLAADADEKIGKRSNEIIAERNGMSIKQVQRHIALTKLTPALQEYVDGKLGADKKKTIQLAFIPAVELSYIKPEHQNYIAVAIEGQQSTPSLSQAKRLRELDKKGLLNPDVIDGILMEEKKEADKVILSSQELSEYFGKDKTPREMKDTIMKLLGEWKAQQKELATPEKKTKQPEK